MKRGLHSLASIAVTAPFVGVLGWVLGFYNSFPGGEGEKSAMLAIVNERLSEALMPLELGLLVALLAYFGHKYLLAKLEDFDVEMENASLQLLNQLGSNNI
jgi:biopolymer transport protein ExbB/TolQ